MPVDLRIARPFCYRGSDGRDYELGIGYYPAIDDVFAADWWVQSHTESAVLARGGTLFQWRTLLALDPATGAYVPMPGTKPAPIFLDAAINPEYSATIEPNWPPLFVADCDAFPMEHPMPESGCWSGKSLGFNGYRTFNDMHRRPLRTTIKVYPSDPSPPANRAAPPKPARDDEAEVREMQREQLRVVQATTARNTAALPSAPAPTPALALDMARFTWRDPRQAKPVLRIEQQAPLQTERIVPDHYIYEDRIRARLDGRQPQVWAR